MPKGRGRKDPAKLKVLKGTNQPCRSLPNEMDYNPLQKRPAPPAYMSAEAKKEWNTVAAMLFNLQILSPEDLPQLEAYCNSVAMMRKAMRKLNKDGEVTKQKGQRGQVYYVRSKWFDVFKDATERMMKFSAKFGLSPADKTRVNIPKNAPNSDDQFFGTG